MDGQAWSPRHSPDQGTCSSAPKVALRTQAGQHVPMANSFSYAFGPMIALVAIGILVLILRWAFNNKRSSVVAAAAKPGSADEYGMLLPIASPATYIDGEIVRRRLEDAGIRANLATTLDGPRVMVWPQDEQRARELLTR